MGGQYAPAALKSRTTNAVRTKTGSPVTADSATLSDGNFPPANACDCTGWRRILVLPRFTGGASQTVTLQVLYRLDGAWTAGDKTADLGEGELAEIDVYGQDVFLRIDAVTGNPTTVVLRVIGWEPFEYTGRTKG
jgi:hypothetical protein